MISTEMINKVKDSMIDRVKENFKKDGHIVPVAILLYEDGSGEAVATAFGSKEEREAFAESLRKRCAKKKPIVIALIEEAHSIRILNDRRADYLDDKGYLREGIDRPSKSAESVDIIVISFETPFTSEAVVIETSSVGGEHLIVDTVRKGSVEVGLFKDILARPTNHN